MIECVTFILDEQKYAIDIMRIREVREWEQVREVPNSPADIIGILDIRGKIVPIFDLKLKFGFGANEIDDDKAVIILKFDQNRIGFVVDSVSDIEKVAEDEFKDADSFKETIKSEFIQSVFTKDSHVIMMLNVDELFYSTTQNNNILKQSNSEIAA